MIDMIDNLKQDFWTCVGCAAMHSGVMHYENSYLLYFVVTSVSPKLHHFDAGLACDLGLAIYARLNRHVQTWHKMTPQEILPTKKNNNLLELGLSAKLYEI